MICTPYTGCPVLGGHITLECLYLFVHLCIFSNLLIYSLNQKSQQVGRAVCLGREGVRETPISDIL